MGNETQPQQNLDIKQESINKKKRKKGRSKSELPRSRYTNNSNNNSESSETLTSDGIGIHEMDINDTKSVNDSEILDDLDDDWSRKSDETATGNNNNNTDHKKSKKHKRKKRKKKKKKKRKKMKKSKKQAEMDEINELKKLKKELRRAKARSDKLRQRLDQERKKRKKLETNIDENSNSSQRGNYDEDARSLKRNESVASSVYSVASSIARQYATVDKKKGNSIDISDTKSVHSTHSNYVATQSISNAMQTDSMSTTAVPLKIPMTNSPENTNQGLFITGISNNNPNDLSQIRENSRTMDDDNDGNVILVGDFMTQFAGLTIDKKPTNNDVIPKKNGNASSPKIMSSQTLGLNMNDPHAINQ